MGGSSTSDSVDLEKGVAVELDEDAASDRDALTRTGTSLACLLLMIDVPVLVFCGPWAALAAAIVFVAVVLVITWCVLESGRYYRDEELQGSGDSLDAAPAPAERRSSDVVCDALLILPALIPIALH